jgi:V8-like Glu-specific endopeptidase
MKSLISLASAALVAFATGSLASSINFELFNRQFTCSNNPIAKADFMKLAELINSTKEYMPKIFNGTADIPGFIPKDTRMVPKADLKLELDRFYKELAILAPNSTAMFARKQVLNMRSYPWNTIGKINVYLPSETWGCSGALVGRNLIATASHCVPWGQSWSMEFIPAFNGEDVANPQPFGNVWVTQCRGVKNTDDVTGLDYVVCQLNSNMGDRVGYMGWKASTGDSFYMDGAWTSVGYPADFHNGIAPAMEDGIKLDDVDDEGSDGKELESYVYSSKGWSGGPFFRVESDGPKLVGVLSGYEEEFSVWDWFIAKHTVNAGGMHLGQLITYGRTNWAPSP